MQLLGIEHVDYRVPDFKEVKRRKTAPVKIR